MVVTARYVIRLLFETLKIFLVSALVFNNSSAGKIKVKAIVSSFVFYALMVIFKWNLIFSIIPVFFLYIGFFEAVNVVWNFIFSYFMVQTSDSISLYVIKFISGNKNYHPYSEIGGLIKAELTDILVLSLICLCLKAVTRRHRVNEEKLGVGAYINLIVIGLLMMFSISAFRILLEEGTADRVKIFLMISVSLLLIIFMMVVLLQNYLYGAKSYLEKLSEAQKELRIKEEKHFAEQINNYEKLRVFKHNIDHSLLQMTKMCEDGNVEKIREMLVKINGEVDFNAMTDCGCPAIDVFISKYRQESEDRGISFKVLGHIDREPDVSEYDISVIIGNLLQNAYEESEAYGKGAEISIEFKNSGGVVYIKISNKSRTEKMSGKLPETTKDNKKEHGIGLKSVKKIIEKYPNGNFKWACLDHIFSVYCVLPVIKQN